MSGPPPKVADYRIKTDWGPRDAYLFWEWSGFDHVRAAFVLGHAALEEVRVVGELLEAEAAEIRARTPDGAVADWLCEQSADDAGRVAGVIVAEHYRRQELLLAVVRAHTETEGD